jgi:hypothetical protein
MLPGRLQVTITEKAPALVWETRTQRLLIAPDGPVLGVLPFTVSPEGAAARLPTVRDDRTVADTIGQGDSLAAADVELARRLARIDAAVLGSRARHLTLRVDDTYGFVVVADVGWEAAFGFAPPALVGSEPGPAQVLDEQFAAVRTLFATRPERSVSWIDVRNPGKVYWAP